MKKYLYLLICFLGVFLTASEKTNIVLILADDMGYGDLGCFGQKTLKTPHLDKMAGDGMRFIQFYSGNTVCAPSRSVLMTGLHSGRTLIRGNGNPGITLKPDTPTLASILKKAGYETACIGKFGLGSTLNLNYPKDLGFDHFYGYINNGHAHNFYPEFLVRNGKEEKLKNVLADKWRRYQDQKSYRRGMGVASKKVDYAPDLLMTDALNFIDKNKAKPFFLYLALNTPHANNEGGRLGMEVPDHGEFASIDWTDAEKGFASMIKNIDRDVGRLLNKLKDLGIDKNTLVIFTSDNGPHNEGGHKAGFFDSNGKFRGIKRNLTEGGIRVPTIAYWPGTIKAGSSDNSHWYFGDFMTTFAELAGVESPEKLDSESFLETLKGNPRVNQWKRTTRMYWEFYEGGSAQAVRFGKWKAIRQPMFTGKLVLYDMSNDGGEKRDYAEERPDLAKLAARLMDEAHTPSPHWKVRKK